MEAKPPEGNGTAEAGDKGPQGRDWDPVGLRVMVVDDDPLCLRVVEQMLKRCNYEVRTCSSALSALELLREERSHFDLVLSDVYMPDMDGFKLLETVGLELDLPVIMMSSNGEHTTVLRGVTHGACDFLIKPVRIEELRNIWQHVIRRQKSILGWRRERRGRGRAPGGGGKARAGTSGLRPSRSAPHPPRNRNPRSAAAAAPQRDEEGSSSKKQRVVWSVEMHQQFVAAVNQLGIDKAAPKKILELMNVEGLTRENVASHLQKYRLYLKRVQVGRCVCACVWGDVCVCVCVCVEGVFVRVCMRVFTVFGCEHPCNHQPLPTAYAPPPGRAGRRGRRGTAPLAAASSPRRATRRRSSSNRSSSSSSKRSPTPTRRLRRRRRPRRPPRRPRPRRRRRRPRRRRPRRRRPRRRRRRRRRWLRRRCRRRG
ncbi:MAG: hypothetical protein J3K34DRAFT_385996 [Monoraphidium minutum]|nr:MAG: hypothetical protein J3K34DRAFT_385996 [Monoraphidium minutum]